MAPRSRKEIVARFENGGFDPSTQQYLRFHALRYEFLLATIERAMACVVGTRPTRILDIGASFQTLLLRDAYPDAAVDTLGFDDARWRSPHHAHILFDLNDAVSKGKWPVVEPYDVVVMTEVIEHVYTAARVVLECVASLLRPGGTLILQTPNAVSLYVRAGTLLGRNPHHMIREEPTNPGHFCEFTVAELRSAVEAAGFEAGEIRLANYFGDRDGSMRYKLYDFLCAVLPGELADGITLTARKK
jgi:2-polyprenyl-3-methyl-5-hydroxy-6-metoxy-1,4-benzoquinol methylase